jgi:hypothetical protein
MKSKKKMPRQRFNRYKETSDEAYAHRHSHIRLRQQGDFIRKPKCLEPSMDVLERLDFLACLFSINGIK